MKTAVKRLFALFLILTMITPPATVSSFALEADDSIGKSWNIMAAKFRTGTWGINAPKSNDFQILTTGFTFNESSEGGIKITTPDYNTFKGVYGTTAVSSKNPTALDGLSVVISADEYDSMIDSIGAGNSIGILWSEEKIEALAGFNETSKSYTTGLFSAVSAYSNGLRHLIPVVENATPLTPAYLAGENTNGKALFIRITCDKKVGENAEPVATAVSIVYYDGYYIGDDGHPGYRWSFSAKNHEDTRFGDNSDISRGYESIDLRNGLSVNVRADDTLGYIVNINGYDYYKGEEVGYFPDCDTDWVGYKTKKDENGEDEPIRTTSMTYARNDIDLSGLRDAEKGYLTVGAVSINDKTHPDHRCNYTIESINGVPAAKWAGEATPEHECSFEFVTTFPANCTRDGYDYYRCTVCGAAKNENTVPATGHTPYTEVTPLIIPTCATKGLSVLLCRVCKARLERTETDMVPHTFSKDWEGSFDCENGGTRTNTCDVCNNTVTQTLEPGHIYEWKTITNATCITPGSKTEFCTECGAEGETQELPLDPEAHTADVWEPVVVDGTWDGVEKAVCTACGAEAERRTEVYDCIKHFTDTKKGAWYEDEVAYCVRRGYVSGMTETTFAPNANLTRAQFLTLLAKVDGVDLSAYEGKDSGFEDVKPTHWWNNVVCWAAENNITGGISATKFGPADYVTRAQLARFFYVYTEKTGGDVSGTADIAEYPDAGKVPAWAKTPIEWAVDAGLISGVAKNGVNYLDPNGTATRAQAARMIMIYTTL